MAKVEMPEPPEGHYWRIAKWPPTESDLMRRLSGLESRGDRMRIELRTAPYRTWWGGRRGNTTVVSKEIDWLVDEERNAERAAIAAQSLLERPEVTHTHGLNGLTGYTWGGAV